MGFSVGSVFKEATDLCGDVLSVVNTVKSVAEATGVKTVAAESPFGKFASVLADVLASQKYNQANLSSKEELFPIFIGQSLSVNSLRLAEDYEYQLEKIRSDPNSSTSSEDVTVQAMNNLVAKGKLKKEDSDDLIKKASSTFDNNSNGFQEFAKNPLVTSTKVGASLLNYYTSLGGIKNIFS